MRIGRGTIPAGYADDMIAEIFHWWLGVGLTIVGVLAVVSTIRGYVKKVVAPQYPGKRNRED